jgi:hypothetical protein
VVALQDALDGTLAREGSDGEALQLGVDGPLQLGRDALGDVVVGPGQVVEALGASLRVVDPPLAEPDLGAADGGANGLGGSASEA